MLERSLHSRMWLLRNNTFNPRCPQIKARSLFLFIGCLNLSISNDLLTSFYFLRAIRIEVCYDDSFIHIKTVLFAFADESFLGHFWPGQNSPSTSQLFVQFKSVDKWASPVRTGSAHTCSHFPSVVRIAVSIVFVTNNNFGNVCVSIKVSALLRYNSFCMLCYVVSTVAHCTVPCESIRPPWTLRPFATFQASNIKI